MVDQSVPVEDHELTDHEAAVDWLHGQPYAEWSAGRGAECPVIASEGSYMGPGTSYQILRYKDAESVLRDPDTFSSSINGEHIGQFMGDLILAMNGAEHRMYRNLVAKAFRASQLERWDETLVRPMIDRLLDAIAPTRPRRSRRVGHVGLSRAGDLRHRGRAARGRSPVRAVGRADQHGSVVTRRGHGRVAGDGRLPAAARGGAPRRADRRLPLRSRARGSRRRAAHRLEDLRILAAAAARRRRDDVPGDGQLPRTRCCRIPTSWRASTPIARCCPR